MSSGRGWRRLRLRRGRRGRRANRPIAGEGSALLRARGRERLGAAPSWNRPSGLTGSGSGPDADPSQGFGIATGACA
jgi:hypothetical protein